MRNNMITTLAEDYVRMARAKGLPEPADHVRLRGPQRDPAEPVRLRDVARLRASAARSWSSTSSTTRASATCCCNAVENTDYPLMQALFLLITVAVLVAILIADFVTRLLDPRTRARASAMSAARDRRDPAPAACSQRASAGIWPRGSTNRKAMVGLILFVIFCLVALFPGLFAHRHSPDARRLPAARSARPRPTCSAPPRYGQDIYAQLIYGTRQSLIIALVVGLLRHRALGADRRLRRLPRRPRATRSCRCSPTCSWSSRPSR